MNIKHWPMNTIMELPEWCFGRQWPIGLSVTLKDENAVFDIAEAALPEQFVIWRLLFPTVTKDIQSVDIGLALGDTLPGNEAEFAALELLFTSFHSPVSGQGHFEASVGSAGNVIEMRHPVKAAGRRLVGRFIRQEGVAVGAGAIVIVSSLPTKIPGWLSS
ncbi:hypothetical protein ES703_37913 [subsurface metagenome]